VTDLGLAQLAALAQLRGLLVAGCDRITDAGVAQLVAAGELMFSSVGGGRLSTILTMAEGVACFVRWIRGEACSDQLLHCCGAAGLPLKHLDLRACVRLTDACLLALASRCGRLRRLHLDNCAQLTTAGIVKVPGRRLTTDAFRDTIPCAVRMSTCRCCYHVTHYVTAAARQMCRLGAASCCYCCWRRHSPCSCTQH
jgi:hypothetical protein